MTVFDLPELDSTNPFATESKLPYGLEDFAAIQPEHFAPALDLAIARLRDALAHVEADPSPATFDNTIAVLETAGAPLTRVYGTLSIIDASNQTEPIRELTVHYDPLLSDVLAAQRLSPILLGRVREIEQSGQLSGEQLRVTVMLREDLEAAGAGLSVAGRARLQEIAGIISSLSVEFSSNLVDASKAADFWVDDVADLSGLSEGRIGAARAAAQAKDPEKFAAQGGYLMEIRGLANLPEVRELQVRAMREKVYRAAKNRCVDANLALATQIAALRAEVADLLGVGTYHALFASTRTAKTPGAVAHVLDALTGPAVAASERELELIRSAATRDGVETVEPWDISFYLEQLKLEQFDLDASTLKSYFELNNVVEKGIFFAAEKLYGITFLRRPDLVGYLPDVQVWEVFEGPVGEPNTGDALFLADFFTRDTKRPGAWMNAFRFHCETFDTRPIVINNCNYIKPVGNTPCLLTLQDVTTLFHEFGHALHGLFSRSVYPSTTTFQVAWDFVEFPSQVNEMWALWPEVLENYALHVETGEVLPQETVEKIEAAKLWGMGLATAHQITNNAVDIAWHSLQLSDPATFPNSTETATVFEREQVINAGITFPHLSERLMSTSYTHIFSGGYSGGYYTYLWSETFDADTVEWYKANGGLTRANGDRFREYILGIGATRDALDAYRDFMGREVSLDPLLRRCGFAH